MNRKLGKSYVMNIKSENLTKSHTVFLSKVSIKECVLLNENESNL